MEFKTFFSMMKNRISDGADVPYFFKDLVDMITDVREDEWGTPKDPSTKLSKESTLRSYAKRGLTKKFAESIVYRLTPENFVESLKTRPATVFELNWGEITRGAMNMAIIEPMDVIGKF